jgi:1-acyl-sn-glycerol-3-phosphate acyltransferase
VELELKQNKIALLNLLKLRYKLDVMRTDFLIFAAMKILLLPFIVLYRIYFALVFFTVLALLYPIFWFLLLSPKNYERVFKLKVFTARLILFLDFIFLVKANNQPDLTTGPYVVCANHSSYLDIILMYRILPHTKFLFIGKSELLKWPIINIFFKKVDIAVDRNKRNSAMRSIEKAKEELGKGWSIIIFPEGGIPDNAPVLNKFKNGAFRMAIESGASILPITILDNWRLFSTNPLISGFSRPGKTRVIIHEPISTHHLDKKDLVDLREETFNTINQPLVADGINT